MSTTNETAVATKPAAKMTIKDRLQSDSFRKAVAEILPKHLTPERMARVAIAAMTRTPLLAQCDQASFFAAMMNLSQWGLEPDGRRAHLIPFRNNKSGTYEVQVIVDYKGLVELAMRSGTVSRIHADVVCENDQFEYDRGEIKVHRIDFRKPRGAVYAFYCIITLRDGGTKCEVMTKDEVETIRKRSRAANAGPWVSDWAEMGKKTVFRRAAKWIQLSAEFAEAIEKDADQLEETRFQAAKPVFVSPPSSDALPLFAQDDAPAVLPELAEAPQPAPEPPQVKAAEIKELSPRKQIEDAIISAGLTFDDFMAWLKESGEVPGELEFGSFAELPIGLCKRCAKAITPLVKAIKDAKEAV